MTDREQWLAQRKQYVTASDVAAMLDESPYKTREQLIAEKRGEVEEWAGNETTDLGLELERPVLDIASKRYCWRISPNSELVPDKSCLRLAATPDATMTTPWGNAVIQVKVTSSAATEDTKPTTAKGAPTRAAFLGGPPIYYQLQVQAEMACTGYHHGVLLVLHTARGLKLRPYYIPRHERVIVRIRNEALRLWKEVER